MREDFWRIWSFGFYLPGGSCTYSRYSRRPYAKQNKFESALDLALGSSARYSTPHVRFRTNYIFYLTMGSFNGPLPSNQWLVGVMVISAISIEFARNVEAYVGPWAEISDKESELDAIKEVAAQPRRSKTGMFRRTGDKECD